MRSRRRFRRNGRWQARWIERRAVDCHLAVDCRWPDAVELQGRSTAREFAPQTSPPDAAGRLVSMSDGGHCRVAATR